MQNSMSFPKSMGGVISNRAWEYPLVEDSYSGVLSDSKPSDKFPPGMAYVPVQQWEEPYSAEEGFSIGTIFPALNYPFKGGGPCV